MAEFIDPYLDPATGILRNKVGALDQASLDAAEADLATARLNQLGTNYPIRPTGDLVELQGIHRHLFQDVYDWAGQIRTVDIKKPDGEWFLPVSMISRSAGYAVDELRADRHLRGMSREQFVKRLAHHYDQINYLHPFREGNGRTQRVFWSRIARDAGWPLDWSTITAERNNTASRLATESTDLAPLREMFHEITASTRTTTSGRAAGNALDPRTLLTTRRPADRSAEAARRATPPRAQGRGRSR